MAVTNNGIYYPSDYSKPAVIPADLKIMAESIDDKVSSIFNINFKIKGIVESVEDLTNVLEVEEGDVYILKDSNIAYCYHESEWMNLGVIFNASAIEDNIKQKIEASVSARIEALEQKGIYRLITGTVNVSAVGSEIELNDSIKNYDFLIITTGTLGIHSTLKQNVCIPWGDQWIIGEAENSAKYFAVNGGNGDRISLYPDTETKLVISSNSGTTAIRAVFGVKL